MKHTSIAEAARLMGLPYARLRRRVRQGEVPYVVVEGHAGLRIPTYVTREPYATI